MPASGLRVRRSVYKYVGKMRWLVQHDVVTALHLDCLPALRQCPAVVSMEWRLIPTEPQAPRGQGAWP